MNWIPVKPTLRRSLVSAMLATLSARPAAALISSPYVHLLQGNVVISPDTTLAALQAAEATYTGYTPIALPTLAGPANLRVDTEGMIANVDFLVGANAVISNNITGYWVDQGGPDWVVAEIFPQVLPMVRQGDLIDLQISIPQLMIPLAQ
jgi:hypothetical protein